MWFQPFDDAGLAPGLPPSCDAVTVYHLSMDKGAATDEVLRLPGIWTHWRKDALTNSGVHSRRLLLRAADTLQCVLKEMFRS
jgi:hypothetical protein